MTLFLFIQKAKKTSKKNSEVETDENHFAVARFECSPALKPRLYFTITLFPTPCILNFSKIHWGQ